MTHMYVWQINLDLINLWHKQQILHKPSLEKPLWLYSFNERVLQRMWPWIEMRHSFHVPVVEQVKVCRWVHSSGFVLVHWHSVETMPPLASGGRQNVHRHTKQNKALNIQYDIVAVCSCRWCAHHLCITIWVVSRWWGRSTAAPTHRRAWNTRDVGYSVWWSGNLQKQIKDPHSVD